MKIARTIAEYRQLRGEGSVGFVPTMGYLHAGHAELMKQARQANERVVVSIFVNPTQFNNPKDLETYPRDEAQDLALLEKMAVDIAFLPSPTEMYPPHFQTYVTVEELSKPLEGEHRAGHFRGVATVVTKLFNIIQPDRAYFGQKDAQQVMIIQRLVEDLNIPVKIVVCPTIRESSGLALSSRNARLSPSEKAAAPIIYRALLAARSKYLEGERHPETLRQTIHHIFEMESAARVEYVSVADMETLTELHEPTQSPILISLAVYFGRTRLIDNILLS